MKRSIEIVCTVLLVLYPLGIWAGLSVGGGRAVGIFALIPLLLLFALRRRNSSSPWSVGYLLVLPGLALISVLLDRQRLLLAAPVIINIAFLVVFGSSLLAGRVPMVERFARVMDADFPSNRVSYCRTVTMIWCAFFIINGSVALWLSVYGSLAAWALYTGVIAYGLMGLLFAAEYTVRRIRFR